jgi:hypothetical protein
MTKDIVLNSVRRTGNTFLANALELSYVANQVDWEKYKINSHMHNMFLHRIPQSSNFYQVTNLRNPEDTIISNCLFVGNYTGIDMKLESKVKPLCDHNIDSYNIFYSEWIKNKNSKIVMFEDIISDVNSVLRSMYSDLEIDYNYDIKVSEVIDKTKKEDLTRGEGVFSGHLPRGSQDTEEYRVIRRPSW